MYPRILQIEGCDQREHFEDGLYPRLLQIEGCDQREHFEDEYIANGIVLFKKCMN